MNYQIIDKFLDIDDRCSLSTFLDNSSYWDSFSEGTTTNRVAFSFTLKADELPDYLLKFKTSKHNLYHFVAIKTFKSGAIEEHVDFALGEDLIEEQPGIMISRPETVIYYETIDNEMLGGKLILRDTEITPKENTAVILNPGVPHGVSEIQRTEKPRTVFVCERYRVLSKYLNNIKTPEYSRG